MHIPLRGHTDCCNLRSSGARTPHACQKPHIRIRLTLIEFFQVPCTRRLYAKYLRKLCARADFTSCSCASLTGRKGLIVSQATLMVGILSWQVQLAACAPCARRLSAKSLRKFCARGDFIPSFSASLTERKNWMVSQASLMARVLSWQVQFAARAPCTLELYAKFLRKFCARGDITSSLYTYKWRYKCEYRSRYRCTIDIHININVNLRKIQNP